MVCKIVITEYASLIKNDVTLENFTLSEAYISASAFEWLESKLNEENTAWKGILKFVNSKTIRVSQFVGYIQTPCGLGIEILPKVIRTPKQLEKEIVQEHARKTLWDIFSKALKLKSKQLDLANLKTRTQPIDEWVYGQFLSNLKILLARGIMNDYERIEEENRFIRGQLDITKQIVNNIIGRKTHFHIRHDVYTPNRLENRLIATTIRKIIRFTQNHDIKKRAKELASLFSDIPDELNPNHVWNLWGKERSLLHYEPIKLWCQLILFGQNPELMHGDKQGLALLFDMNKVFESYVAECLKDIFKSVETQVSHKKLLQDPARKFYFTLKPDLFINKKIIADCKWKLLNQNQGNGVYQSYFNLTQNDLYQLGMYGNNYFKNGNGQLVIIYPEHESFNEPLHFNYCFNQNLQLIIVPFSLNWDVRAQTKIKQWVGNLILVD